MRGTFQMKLESLFIPQRSSDKTSASCLRGYIRTAFSDARAMMDIEDMTVELRDSSPASSVVMPYLALTDPSSFCSLPAYLRRRSGIELSFSGLCFW